MRTELTRERIGQGTSILAALGLALLLVVPALAQPAPEPAPPPGMPKMADPPAESTPAPDTKSETSQPEKPLSEQLKEKEGVLEPPRDMDSKIQKAPPVPDPNTTPVIPPPGEPGGDQSIQPK